MEQQLMWNAVAGRDANADGKFWYSVKTMGVYCRPSCKSRLPRRENVQFHLTREDAERAGFRACKRCKPNLEREVIRYAVGPCSLGLVLTAYSSRGVCAILLGDDTDTLAQDLARRFPDARLMRVELSSDMARIVEGAPLSVPLDIRGTVFQRRVWDALRQVPAGTTATYRDIAELIGDRKASRAVARACGANALAVAIPCHRVVRGDGDLSGYRWGVERKRALLAREAHA